MAKIIAIGGWELREKSTLEIDKEIITFSGKKKPKILFIPTASSDAEGYFHGIKKYFEDVWCKVNVLYLIKETPTKKEIQEKILAADIIYVGGGNTLKMMNVRRKLGVDKALEKALKKNIVLSGLSAWSICWFTYGNSDSRKFTSKSTQLIKVKGLDFIHALHCPHYDIEIHRQEELKRMMKKSPLVAIALENDCAIQIKNNEYRIITSKKWAKAYKIYRKKNQYYKEELQQKKDYMPIIDILKK